MAKHGFKVLDSDTHILEPADFWQRYIGAIHMKKVRGYLSLLREEQGRS